MFNEYPKNEYPKFEKVDNYTFKIIVEQGTNVTLTQLLDNQKKLLDEKKRLEKALKRIVEAIKEAKKLGIKESVKDNK